MWPMDSGETRIHKARARIHTQISKGDAVHERPNAERETGDTALTHNGCLFLCRLLHPVPCATAPADPCVSVSVSMTVCESGRVCACLSLT